MSARLLHPDEYELEARSSVDSQGTFNLDEADFESQSPPRPRRLLNRSSFLSRLFSSSYTGYRRLKPSRRILSASRPSCYRRLLLRRSFPYLIAGLLLIIAAIISIFRPSITRPPPHYSILRDIVSNSTASGRGNIRNETVFIAASLYDRGGHLAGGEWGDRVLQLIDLLGKDNVFLSIYENDSGPEGDSALRNFAKRVPSKSSIVSEEHLDLEKLPKVTTPSGEKRINRIEYLAEVRNRALKPLDDHPEMRYDKLLYLNDVIFDPVDALQLLFSTNADGNGVAQYRAACAVDYISPFKFYDTYATRDLQGYSMGLPIYPWFSTAGSGDSRKDVLAGKDAVRVRSCWGGMVAFDAKFFQHDAAGKDSDHAPARFRALHELFWEASECCLIHADIQKPQVEGDKITDTGIYMNPYVRVAYDIKTFSWLKTTRRWEKLLPSLQKFITRMVGLPWANDRRADVPGQTVQHDIWVPDSNAKGGGSWEHLDRIASNDGFCGRQRLQVIVEHREEGQEGYEFIQVP